MTAPPLRRAMYVALGCFILLAPAAPQIFGVNSVLFRPWIMYSLVGVGVMRGDFVAETAAGGAKITPFQVMMRNRYPQDLSLNAGHVVLDERTLKRFTAPYCAQYQDVIALTFEGEVAFPDGWRALSAEARCDRP
ncbi:MAG: hypothetical protein AAF401_01025 [Pseudomonadota bacterium]